jgi:hypothetical protein
MDAYKYWNFPDFIIGRHVLESVDKHQVRGFSL